jgi:mono/diheme cytochrome c family protein
MGLAVERMREMGRRLAALYRFLFGDSVRAFGSLSLVLLACLAVVPAKDYFREWIRIQNQYSRLIRNRGDAATLQRRFQGGLQQIWLPRLGVVDRCTTCHVALREASLADVSLQPFRPHPVIPHSLDQFGCVFCHRGQGAATTVEEAHRSTKAWEQPLLPARYLESSCGQCHQNALPGTPQLNMGRKLLARYGCVNCHTLSSPAGVRMKATDDPPELTHIAQKTTREWIFAWLKNPQAYAVSATMPNFELSDADARDISAFLIDQSTPLGPTAEAKPKPPGADAPQAGATLYGESFCASCHAAQNAAGILTGGDVGPELTRIGSKVKPEWLLAWLRDPHQLDPNTAMPHYRFNEKQLGLLASFLESKTDSDFTANVHLEAATKEQAEHGRTLVNERGCASCHQINGVKRPDNFAPELTAVGSRPLAKIVFAPGVPYDLPSYLEAKIREPHSFGTAMKMPKFMLAASQVEVLVTALLAQTDRGATVPVELRVAGHPESDYQPAGSAGKLMDDLRCFSCHSINGRGGDMAPDLTSEGSSVQRAWLLGFLKDPNTLRPALIRRMPRFNLTDAEAGTLTDYIMTVYQTPAFDSASLPASGFAAADREQGRQLFYSKYACQSCHIVDPNNDKGYIGPTLTVVGVRRTAAWIFHYLKDPQALRPATLEPNQHISDEDARALTAFLMAQTKTPPQPGGKK